MDKISAFKVASFLLFFQFLFSIEANAQKKNQTPPARSLTLREQAEAQLQPPTRQGPLSPGEGAPHRPWPQEGVVHLKAAALNSQERSWAWHLGVKAQTMQSTSLWHYSDLGSVSLKSLEKSWLPTLELGTTSIETDRRSSALLFQFSYLTTPVQSQFSTNALSEDSRLNLYRISVLPEWSFALSSQEKSWSLTFGPELSAYFFLLSSPDSFARGAERILLGGAHLGIRKSMSARWAVSGRYHAQSTLSASQKIDVSKSGVDLGVEARW